MRSEISEIPRKEKKDYIKFGLTLFKCCATRQATSEIYRGYKIARDVHVLDRVDGPLWVRIFGSLFIGDTAGNQHCCHTTTICSE